MLFNVTRAVNFILDDRKSRYFRAIKLFELHVAICLANGYPRTSRMAASQDNSLPSPVVVRVSKRKMYDAKMFATIKLMEHLEQRVKEEWGTISADILTWDPEWTKLFDKKFVRCGGFSRARYLPHVVDYDIELWEAKRRAKKVAQLIDFSLRFEPDPTKPKQIGGITMARTIVAESNYFDVRCTERTLETYWKKFEPVAAFLPLIFLKKYPASPLRLSKTKFAEKLLARLDDRYTLLSFFADYNATVARLQARGYDLRSLAGFPTSEIAFDPLPQEVLEAVQGYTA